MTKKAILYVEDFENLLFLAQFLEKDGWTIYSNNKTAEFLKKNNISFKYDLTLENLNRNITERTSLIRKVLKTQIDFDSNDILNTNDTENNYFLVCVNIDSYKYAPEFFQNQKTYGPAIDLFYSTLIRSAATNYKNVILLTDPADYKEATIQLRTNNVRDDFRLYLAGKGFNLVSAYDASNACTILQNSPYTGSSYMNYFTLPYKKIFDLHYGINPQQTAALYQLNPNYGAVSGFKKLQGRELTHKIITDTAFAWNQIDILYKNLKTPYAVKSENCDGYPFTTQFTPLTGTVFTVIVKYRVIIGAGLDTNVLDSFKKTISYDPETIEHASIGCSAVIDEEAAREIAKYNFSALIAPGFTEPARQILSENRTIRLILATRNPGSTHTALVMDGAILVQTLDKKLFEKWIVPTKTRPNQKYVDELAFGTTIVMTTQSYASVAIKDNAIVGIACGLGSRKKSLENVCYEAKQTFKLHPTEDNRIIDVLICDSPIEFCEPIKEMIDRGLSAIIQTGGNPNDREFIDYCDAHGVAMIFTGMTHHNY